MIEMIKAVLKLYIIIIVMFTATLPNEFDFNINLEDEPMVDPSPGSLPEDILIKESRIYCYSTCGKRSANFDQVPCST